MERGRPCGYGVKAICDFPGCTTKIDRGLAFVCGGMHDGGEHGCGGYFCEEHRSFAIPAEDENGERVGELCPDCLKEWEAAHPEEE